MNENNFSNNFSGDNQDLTPENRKIISKNYFIAGIAIGLILALTGIYFWVNFHKSERFVWFEKGRERKIQAENSATERSKLVETNELKINEVEEESRNDCKEGEKYTNIDVGYSLCIPNDWTVKETDKMSQIVGKKVKNIEIFSPDKKYMLYFALKKSSDNFALGDWTGMPAGESQKIDEIFVLDQKMIVQGHFFQGEIRKIIFPWTELMWKNIKYETLGFIDKDKGDTYDPGKGINPKDPMVVTAKKIYSSLAILENSGENGAHCPSDFTASEKGAMEDWPEYVDKKNKFSFRYPKGAEISQIDQDVVNINGKDGSTLFSVRSNVMAAEDFYAHKIINKTNVKVDCVNAVRIILSTDLKNFPQNEKRNIISTLIERENTRQRLEMNFPDLKSASLESDYYEMYDMVLKSIKLN